MTSILESIIGKSPLEPRLDDIPRSRSFDPPRVKSRSEAAAEAIEQWEELERALREAQTQVAQSNSHICVIEESNAILHDEIAKLRREIDRLIRENTTIHTRLQMAAQILLNIMTPVGNRLDQPQLDQPRSDGTRGDGPTYEDFIKSLPHTTSETSDKAQ